MKKHLTTRHNRIITEVEWSAYLGISRHTVRSRIEAFEDEDNVTYNPRDIYSVLDFFSYVIDTLPEK